MKVITGPTKCSGDVARVIELPDGSGRIEMWEKGKGWVDAAGRVNLHEFMPGSGLPVSALDAARLGIPASEIGEFHCWHWAGRPTRGFICN